MAIRNIELILSDEEMSLLEEIVEFERDWLKKNPPEYFEAFGVDTVVNVVVRNFLDDVKLKMRRLENEKIGKTQNGKSF